jgi:outer membrane protein
MKAVRLILILAVASLAAVPAFAQSRSVDLTGYVSWMDPSGDNTIVDDPDGTIDINFDADQGFGIALDVFWSNRISTELAVMKFSPEAAFEGTGGFESLIAGDLDMMPITATLRFHFAPESRFDPYIGAGVAYVLFDEISSRNLSDIDIDALDVDDDYGFLLNAGFSFDITPNFALVLDAKYVPVESSINARGAGPAEALNLEINPLILSAGLSFQF